jgi:hypothetical protein
MYFEKSIKITDRCDPSLYLDDPCYSTAYNKEVVDIEVTRWEDTGGIENKGVVDIEVPTSEEW